VPRVLIRPSFRALPPLLLAAILGGTLAACGGGSGAQSNGLATASATQIWTAAAKAIAKTTSVHVSGLVSTQVNLSMTLFKTGDEIGTITAQGQSVKLVASQGSYYMDGSLTFWVKAEKLPSVTAKLVADKWVKLPTSAAQAFSGFSYAGLLSGLKVPTGKLVKLKASVVGGTHVIGVSSSSSTTLYVPVDGEALPVELAKTPGSTQFITFTAWNQGTAPKAPKALPFPAIG
jgi:hypothetical protein